MLQILSRLRMPLIQAPMAGCQGAELALAVSAAGALGSLPAATLEPQALEQALQALSSSGLPFNLNFFAHATPAPDPARQRRWARRLQPLYDAAGLGEPPPAAPGRRAFDAQTAELLESHRPPLLSFHFGLPSAELLRTLRARGTQVIASATTLEEGLWLQAQGADAVIAQGLEAGGHRGHFLSPDITRQQPLATLLRQLLGHLSVPVIAAGGIGSVQHIRQCMDRGAAAVQLGTAFLLCDEARTPALHRQRLRLGAGPTVLTNLFTGGLARGLPNRLTREFGPVSGDAPPFPWAASALAPLRQHAEARGADDFSPLWCGAGHGAPFEGPAAVLVARLADAFGPNPHHARTP